MDSLRPHGFLEVALQPSYANICDILPQACEIARLGAEQKISGVAWRFLDRSLTGDGRYIGWYIEELYREGTYGKIYKAFRMVVQQRDDGLFDIIDEPRPIIIKRTEPPAGSAVLPKEDITAHTSEALLHVIAWRAMQDTATPWAIPRPFEVFGDYHPGQSGWKSMSLCMSYVNGRTMHSYFEKYWKDDTLAANTRSFLEILAQVAYTLYHLQTRLYLNHRDVKVNNILIRTRKDPVMLSIEESIMASTFESTLIDFGFACVGCPPPKQPITVFQAGSWFPMKEMCCKQGRDLAQLIFCIHCYFPLNKFLTPAVYEEVRNWMRIPWNGGVADGLHGFTNEGRPRRPGVSTKPKYNTGIYEFLRRADVDPAACAPATIFKACCRLLATIGP